MFPTNEDLLAQVESDQAFLLSQGVQTELLANEHAILLRELGGPALIAYADHNMTDAEWSEVVDIAGQDAQLGDIEDLPNDAGTVYSFTIAA